MWGHNFNAETQRRRDKRGEGMLRQRERGSMPWRGAWRGEFSALVSASLRLCGELAFLAFIVTAQQQQMPHAGYAYPAGGRQGTTFEITVGGQFLDGVKSASVSGGGVQATVVDHFKPLTPAQATQ